MKFRLALLLTFFSLSVMAQPYIIAHRGASWLAPENTVASANLAWDLGADAVEIDIYLTRDNKVMLMHDRNTKRTSGGEFSYEIKDTKSRDLRKIDVGSWKGEMFKGEKMPFISEVIKTVPAGKKLVVEIKTGPEIVPFMKKDILKSGKADQMIFIAFGWETILAAKKAFPNNECYWLSSTKKGLLEKMEESAREGLEGVNLNYKIIDQEVMKKAEELGIEVLAWTVNDPDMAKTLLNLGVEKITTDRPRWLKEEIAKR